jgi:hypothetical protein
MSGLEAVYWAQHDPNEVSAIVGLDMDVPAYYQVKSKHPFTDLFASSEFLKALVFMGLDRIPGTGTVQKGCIPNVPMLMFSSDDPALGDHWVPCERSFAGRSKKTKLIQLQCGHMIQYYKSDYVAKETKEYLQGFFSR